MKKKNKHQQLSDFLKHIYNNYAQNYSYKITSIEQIFFDEESNYKNTIAKKGFQTLKDLFETSMDDEEFGMFCLLRRKFDQDEAIDAIDLLLKE